MGLSIVVLAALSFKVFNAVCAVMHGWLCFSEFVVASVIAVALLQRLLVLWVLQLLLLRTFTLA